MTDETEIRGEGRESDRETQRKEIKRRYDISMSRVNKFVFGVVIPLGLLVAGVRGYQSYKIDPEITPEVRIYEHEKGLLEYLNYSLNRASRQPENRDGLRNVFNPPREALINDLTEHVAYVKKSVGEMGKTNRIKQYYEEGDKSSKLGLRAFGEGFGIGIPLVMWLDRRKDKKLKELGEE